MVHYYGVWKFHKLTADGYFKCVILDHLESCTFLHVRVSPFCISKIYLFQRGLLQ